MHHFVAKAQWSDQELLRRVAPWVVPLMDFTAGGWWIIDDTGLPKKRKHSVGVTRQYCGVSGNQDNCQLAVSVKTLALGLPISAFHNISWGKCTNERLTGRFAALRVRCAGGDVEKARLLPEQWLLMEWPADQAGPQKYYLSTLPETAALNDLVNAAHMRWRIKRDYQDLKQDFGLGHYEGRGWRGLRHHATLSIAAYEFLMAQRLNSGHWTLYNPVSGVVSNTLSDVDGSLLYLGAIGGTWMQTGIHLECRRRHCLRADFPSHSPDNATTCTR